MSTVESPITDTAVKNESASGVILPEVAAAGSETTG